MKVFIGTGGIIAIVIVGAVVFIATLVILYFTLFQYLKLKKTVKAMQTRFEKSHAMLFGQDSQYIKRLETISSMNLTFVEDYVEWNRKFKDIRDVLDANAQASINSMQDLMGERRYSDLKAALSDFKKNIDEYERAVNSLDNSLKHKFQEEETCRQLACEQRERFRRVKQDYFSKQGDLTLVSTSFSAMFHKIESLFDSVESNIENAQYIDAKTVLTNDIAPVTDSLGHVLKNLPSMCLSVTTILPEKLSRLSHRYDDLIREKYPLHHILVKGDLATIDDRLSKLAVKIQGLSLKGVNDSLDEISHQIDAYTDAFDKEVAARKRFEEECQNVTKEETMLESTFINLCHSLPTLKKYYLFDSEEQTQVDAIQDAINKAGASKRSLDTYANSAIHQPYTILVEKMDSLKSRNQEASNAIRSLSDYISSLKNDSQDASRDLSSYHAELRKAEIAVRKIHINTVSARFEPDFATLHEKIDELYGLLYSQPMDVSKVKEVHASIKSLGDETFVAVEQAEKNLALAEEEIVKMNRRRNANGEINSILTQAEGLFLNGDFKQSYETALRAERYFKDVD